MPAIFTGKGKTIIEQAQIPKKKKVKPFVPPELPKELQTGATADTIGSQTAGFPLREEQPRGPGQTLTKGQLKPEFQEQEDIAALLEKQGAVSPLEVSQRQLPLPSETPQQKARRETAELFPDFNEILTAIIGVASIVPGVGQVKGFFKGLRADNLHAALIGQANAAVEGIGKNLDPQQAEFLLRQIETKLIKERDQIKVQAQYDIPSLIKGTTTELEEKNLLAFQQLQLARGQAAQALRARMTQQIMSQRGERPVF